jgi:hypothetical protein
LSGFELSNGKHSSYLDDDTDDSESGQAVSSAVNKKMSSVGHGRDQESIRKNSDTRSSQLGNDRQRQSVSSDKDEDDLKESVTVDTSGQSAYVRKHRNKDVVLVQPEAEESDFPNRSHLGNDLIREDSRLSSTALLKSEYHERDSVSSNINNNAAVKDRASENRFLSSTAPIASYSSNNHTSNSSTTDGATRGGPVERIRPHRDITYNPSKADFEKARKLLARSGNYTSSGAKKR